jgi:dTDP-4-dehydrorhamnose 3,5-epimerase-like enzyme
MGESLGNKYQYTLLVPARTLHCFIVVGEKPATLLNFPSRLYDPAEEVRLPFAEHPLADGSVFSWEKVKSAYRQYVQA